MKKKCYLYTRVSTAAQIEGYSLEAQTEKLRGYAAYRELEIAGEYCDAGKSGKSIKGRPAFQQMLDDIVSEKDGISFVLVFKLSRFGRNAADVLKSMQLLADYGVDLVCVEDAIDSSTQGGRLTMAILSAVAEIEKENITVQFLSGKMQKLGEGGWPGGPIPYGYRNINKKLVIEPAEAAFVRQMYEMYADPQVSLHDITKKLTADGMRTYHGRPLSRATLSVILRNPIYVMADLDIYEFYKSQGTDIYNNAADFAGTNGCYYYQGKGNTEDKHKHLQGQTLVLAPHEGFIPSELWLKCRKKLLASHTYQPARKARNTWTAGKIKCGKCGYALMSAHSNGILYMRCTVHADSGACPGCGCVKLHELEAVVYGAMVKKLKDFKTLTGRKKAAKISPKLTAKRLELAQVESEIEKLLDTLTGASPVLLSYVNSRIEELDAKRQSISNEIAKLSADAVPAEKIESISGYLDDWENVSFEDKRQVVDALITVIRATNEKVEIEWKI